jgi:hypothetical protein
MNKKIAVGYLVNGKENKINKILKNFVDSYIKYPSGLDHQLYLIVKNLSRIEIKEIIEPIFINCKYKIIQVTKRGFDMGAYYQFAGQINEELIFPINTNTLFRTHDWLKKIHNNFTPSTGILGSSGSFEQIKTANQYQDYFESFPNPHIRTNGFMIRRLLFMKIVESYLLSIKKKNFTTKIDTFRFESGKKGLTRYLLKYKYDIKIIGANGRAYSIKNWPLSDTFRCNNQANMIISDRQTKYFDNRIYYHKKFFSKMTWGKYINKQASFK